MKFHLELVLLLQPFLSTLKNLHQRCANRIPAYDIAEIKPQGWSLKGHTNSYKCPNSAEDGIWKSYSIKIESNSRAYMLKHQFP